MTAESDSRALDALEDLVQLVQLAEGAAQRLAHEVHGPSFDHAELIVRDMQRLRRSADSLRRAIERFMGMDWRTSPHQAPDQGVGRR
jgi:uncharacterized protein (DUF2342 family)